LLCARVVSLVSRKKGFCNKMLSSRQRIFLFIGLVSGTFFFTVCTGPVFTLFLLKIGVREKVLGMLSMLPSIVGIFSLWMIRQIAENPVKHFISSSWMLFIVEFCFIPVVIVANFLSYKILLVIFSILLCIFHFATQKYVYAWFPVIESIVPYNERGYFLGRLRITLTFAGYLLLVISSKILGPEPEFLKFFYVLLLIWVLTSAFPILLSNTGIPEIKKKPPEKIAFIDEFFKIIFNKDHSDYFKFLSVWTFITGILGPFLIPFYKTQLGLSTSFCVNLVSAQTIGYGLSAFGWGKLVDRHGSRYVLFVSCLLAVLHLFFLSHVHLIPFELMKKLLLVASFFGGVILAGQLMGDTTRRMALAPEENKSSYFAYMLVFGAQLPVIIASPLAGFVLERFKHFHSGIYGIYQIVMIISAFMYCLLLFHIMKMRPVKEKPVLEILRDTISENLMKLKDMITIST